MTIYYSEIAKGFYDSKVGYSTYPEDIIDVTDQYPFLLDQITNNNKQILVQGGIVELIEKISPPVTWEIILTMRDEYLSSSDYTQLADVPIGNREEWAIYRQKLRDIPQDFSEPDHVVWPVRPGEQ